MSRTEDAPGSEPTGPGAFRTEGRVRAGEAGPRTARGGAGDVPRRPRPLPDQPLRARWDPTDEVGRARGDRDRESPGADDADEPQPNALRRFVATYGWRAYAIPVLVVLTVILLVFTIRDSDNDGGAPEVAPDPSARNAQVTEETTPIGAPTGQIQEAQLTAGALPAGGAFTANGKKTFHVVPGTTGQVGTGGQAYTYTVEVEDGLNGQDFAGDRSFAKMVDTTLANGRSWIGDGKVSFRRIDRGEPDLRISLGSTGTTRELCGYQIKLETSCFYPPDKRVTLNEARWVRGAMSYEGDDVAYRQYLVNHEVGHGIGYERHVPCPANGALAPIMMQQSFGTANAQILALDPDMNADPAFVCKPNPWPFPGHSPA
ncbi:DUF3152 domain-containing protein [Gordonia sp. NPDC003376]